MTASAQQASRRGDMPLMSRAAPVSSVNVDERTADVVWTTGAQVKRYDWWNDRTYLEELSLDPGAVRLGRLNGGSAPLLDTHGTWSLRDILGVIERDSASVDGKEGRCQVRFSKRDDVEPIFRDVADGIIGAVSVGYVVHKVLRIAPENETDPWIYRAIDWEPMEVSLVPIPADPDAGVRSQDQAQAKVRTFACEFFDAAPAAPAHRSDTMTDTVNTQPAGSSKPDTDEAAVRAAADAAREAATKAERERISQIRTMVRVAKLDETVATEMIDSGTAVADASKRVFAELAKRDEANNTRGAANIQTLTDETDMRRQAVSDALLHRAAPSRNKLTDAAREYRGMDLIDMARDAIERAGGRTRGMSKREVAVVALNLAPDQARGAGMMGTSDFPIILASTVNRTLRQAYQQAPKTFEPWCRMSTAPDFRQVARTQLSEASAMQAINEGGEYKMMTFSDAQEKYALAKYGGIIALTWEALVNDDLGAFDRIPFAIAQEAAALEGDVVYGILSTNAAMSDTVALFHSTHGNLAGSGGAISDTTLGAGRAAMRKQTGPKGRILNLTPGFLICGPDKEVEANKYTSAAFVAAKASDINPNFNTSLQVVVDGRISGNTWYLSAAPGLVDTIEYAYLEGEQGVYTEQRTGFEVDGLEVKCRLAFAAKAIDWRGVYKNAGA